MTTLNISANSILSKESGKALADALAQNTVLKSLDVSDNQNKWNDGTIKGTLDGAGFAKELAIGLGINGALVSLDISKNRIPDDQQQVVKNIGDSQGIDLRL